MPTSYVSLFEYSDLAAIHARFRPFRLRVPLLSDSFEANVPAQVLYCSRIFSFSVIYAAILFSVRLRVKLCIALPAFPIEWQEGQADSKVYAAWSIE